ncbi:MAG TPA: hypothetical protein VN026_10245 [Bacteroidia bacterium]|nr:hypothetical protein [Bacteroidia bacterium]
MKKTFRRTLLLGIITLSHFISYAQKCKYEKNEIDPVTKKLLKVTERQFLTSRMKVVANILAIKGIKYGDNVLLLCGLTIMSSTSCELGVKKGYKAFLVLEDESSVEIECVQEYKGVVFAQQNYGQFQYAVNPQYLITTDILSKVLDKKVKMIRIEVDLNGNKTNEDSEIRDKDMDEVSRLLKCVM